MQLSELCLRRPVFTIVMNLMLIIVGMVGYSRLEMRDLPKMSIPVASIFTAYTGASAEIIETQVTKPIEDALASLEGLDTLTSKTRDGQSRIVITFKPDYDLEVGVNAIRDKISGVSRNFPDDVSEPVLQKADSNAEPTLYISFSDTVRSNMALTDYVDTYVKPVVEQIEGVGTVDLWGGRDFSVRIGPDPIKMAARNITINDINSTLKTQNVNIAGGEIESISRNYTVVPTTRLQSVEEFANLILKDDNGEAVHLRDVATIEIAPEYEKVIVRADGKPAIVMAVTPQSTANPVTVSNAATSYLEELNESLPNGMSVQVNYDRAISIQASIDNVYKTLVEALLLVILVVFGFLGTLRGTAIPIVTIPICLIAIFGFLYFVGYSINNMTLLALVLAIGLVVDDSIVMLENVHRHIEKGEKPMQAATTATKEIGFAILAMTFTLVAVYAPIGFVEGTTGSIFKEFAFTLAGTVMISGFVALTLSPMLCSRWLTVGGEGRYGVWLNKTIDKLKANYQILLHKCLHFKWLVLSGMLGLVALGGILLITLPAELAPMEDQGVILSFMSAPSAANLAYVQKQVEQIESIYNKLPEKKAYLSINGVPTSNQAISIMVLKDWDKRERSQTELVGALMPDMMSIPGARVFPVENPPLPVSGSDPIAMVVQYPGSYAELSAMMNNLTKEIQKNNPRLTNVRTDLDLDTPQIRLKINREVAADSQVNVADVMETIGTLMGGSKVTELESGAKNYNVKVQLPKTLRENIDQLNGVYVRNAEGKMVSLTSLITISQDVGAQSLSHYDRLRSATLTASLADGYTQGEAVQYLQALAKTVLSEQVKISWSGQVKEYLESSGAMVFTTLLALVFIYLVLSAQFESFRDPLIIMLTVPFSIIGAVLMLSLFGGTNNIYTQIGFVTLIGLVTKHGILITEFANQLVEKGMKLEEAVVESAGTRLRPILMTTGAMVLGAVPLALASGAGAAARTQLGLTIVGGMTVGTLFSLVVVPLVYTLLKSKQAAVAKEN